MYTVYMHEHIESGKKYIGITCKVPKHRWDNGKGYPPKSHFGKAIAKYGWDMFNHIILCTGLSKEEACKMEIDLIAKYNTTNHEHGYNNSTGGELSGLGSRFSMTEETKAKMRKPKSEEHKKHMSEAKKGERNAMYGKHISEENKRKMAEARIGLKHSKERIKKIRESQKNKRAVICLETGEEYISASEASRAKGIDCSCLLKVCKGLRSTAGNLHWQYKSTE